MSLFGKKKSISKSNINELPEFCSKGFKDIEIEIIFSKKLHWYNLIESIKKIISEREDVKDNEREYLLKKFIDDVSNFEKNNNLKDKMVIEDGFLAGKAVEMLRSHIKIKIFKEYLQSGFLCEKCGMDLEGVEETMEGYYVCPNTNCFAVNITYSTPVNNIVNLPMSMESDPNHDKFLTKLIVSKNSIEDDKVFEEIDKYLDSNFRDYKKFLEKKNDTTLKERNMLREIMKKCLIDIDKSQYIDDLNEIFLRMFSWIPPFIPNIEDVKELDKLFCKFWEMNRQKYSRNTTPLVNFRVYCELKTYGYENTSEYINITQQINEDTLRLHILIWGDFCAKIDQKNIFLD